MDIKEVNLDFTNEFFGELKTSKSSAEVGTTENTLAPYDMLLGALGGCFYATFLEIAEKKRINFDSASIYIKGEKKAKPPTTLKWVKLEITIKNSDNNLGLEKSAALATKYCSIYQTISKVADMSWEIIFE